MATLQAKVKSVLSGDTLILTPPNKPDQERTLSLAYVSAPKLNTGEPYGFQSRESLRTLLVGKPVQFRVLYEINGREFGDVRTPIFESLIAKQICEGHVKLRDDASNKQGFEEIAQDLEQAQKKAESGQLGLWNEKNSYTVTSQSIAPDSNNEFNNSIVERVISGDRVQLRVIVNKTTHFVGPCLIAGIKAARSASPDTPAEPFGEEAKQFVSIRLLQRNVGVKFVAKSNTGVPIVELNHPAGDIAKFLLENGLATVADWQSQMLGAVKMGSLRAAETKAKQNKLNLFKNAIDKSQTSSGKQYEAVIGKVVSPDTYVVRTPSGEQTVQLASVRSPRKNDPNQAPFVAQAKEFARSKYIGKKVLVKQEAIRPANEQFEERSLVTITLQDKNIAAQLVSNGWVSVIRHRKDDEDRSPIWDELLELEQKAIDSKKGMYTKKQPPVDRIVEASENVTKARGFLKSLARHPKLNAIVEHVSSGGRLRLSVPKENCNLALVLAGVRVSKPNEPLGDIALDYVNQRLYQRDVYINVENVDKTGAYIGNVYLPGKNLPLSLALVQEGLADVHEFSASQSGYENELYEAVEEAQKARRGIWKDYQEEQVNTPGGAAAASPAVVQTGNLSTASPTNTSSRNYKDIKITSVSPDDCTLYYRPKSSESTITKLLADLTSFNSAATNAAHFKWQTQPRKNDLVTLNNKGKFTRGKITLVERPYYTVTDLDTGKTSQVTQDSLRPLPKQFQSPAATAKPAQLSFIDYPTSGDYLEEYIDYLKDNFVDQYLVLNIDNASTQPESVSLYTEDSSGPTDSVNARLVDNGYVFVKPQLSWEKLGGWKDVLDALNELESAAKTDRVGVWEYGDPRNLD